MDIKVIDGALLLKMFQQGTHVLKTNQEKVDALNVFPVPDGDTGTNMSMTMTSALSEAMKSSSQTVEDVTKAISKGSLMGARGNSGVILSQIFRGFAKACEGKKTLNAKEFAKALGVASTTAYKAVMKPVEGTILTVIRKTAKKATSSAKKNMDIEVLLQILCDEAEAILQTTPSYLEVLRQAGVVDAGGQGLVCILRGFYEVVSGKELPDYSETIVTVDANKIDTSSTHAQVHFDTDDIKYGYCTEFIVKGNNADADEMKAQIQGLGDSMVFVRDDDLTKVHIHTNNPDKALSIGLGMGELVTIKIENMKRQHSAILSAEHHSENAHEPNQVEKKDYSILSVSMGKGLSYLFEELGVDMIIEGGQTMNPSTEDILAAVSKVGGKTVFIFPNNSNIILAAQQAAEISDRDIIVIPTKTIPQGINGVIAFDPDVDKLTNENGMNEAIKEVKTLQITYSVRDTVFADKDIKKGDILGVAEGNISFVGKDVHDVTIKSIEKIIDDNSEVLSIYYGEDITEEVAKKLVAELENKYSDIEIELYGGGQPLYYYICSVE